MNDRRKTKMKNRNKSGRRTEGKRMDGKMDIKEKKGGRKT